MNQKVAHVRPLFLPVISKFLLVIRFCGKPCTRVLFRVRNEAKLFLYYQGLTAFMSTLRTLRQKSDRARASVNRN